MQFLQIPENIKPFVKDIFFIESNEHNKSHSYPFYADGFPGIIYANPTNPFYLKPRNKKLSDFYLYGQTIEPISLDTVGAFQMIGMRLYPFTVRILLDINPKILNDDCFNLFDVKGIDTNFTFNKLRQTNDKDKIVNILSDYFYELMENTLIRIDNRIQLAINFILNSNGNISIKYLQEKVNVTGRTLERNFVKNIGVTPKQFARIIQFSSSLNQLSETEYYNLTEIGYDNGFADQSHFINTFKRYTGKTPKEFQRAFN